MALGNFAAILKSNFSLFSEVIITTNVNSLITAEMNDNGDKIVVSTDQGVQMYERTNSTYVPVGSILTSPSGGYTPFIAKINGVGDRIIVSAKTTNQTGVLYSKIRVYSFDGSNWTQLGNEFIESYANTGIAKYETDINFNGDTIFITHPYRPIAIVYSWDGTTWNQKGTGFSATGSFGFSACINATGDKVAMEINNNGGFSVRIYTWNNTTWDYIEFESSTAFRFDNFGSMGMSISNDGNKLAIGKITSTTDNTMSVLLYEFNGTSWTAAGSPIKREKTTEQIGKFSLSPDASILIIQFSTQNYKIYKWNGINWDKKRENMSYSTIQGRIVTADVDISSDGSLFLLPFDYYDIFKVIKT